MLRNIQKYFKNISSINDNNGASYCDDVEFCCLDMRTYYDIVYEGNYDDIIYDSIISENTLSDIYYFSFSRTRIYMTHL